MNNRIKSLLAEAHLSVEDIKDTNKIAETFAELIIQECAELAETAEPYQSADLIKRHFGIK